MKKQAIREITRKVVKQFPEMDGIKPAVKRQKAPTNGMDQFLLTFTGAAALPGGKKMKRIVRVVADEEGHVIRISTSR
jgi:hypothetical protein